MNTLTRENIYLRHKIKNKKPRKESKAEYQRRLEETFRGVLTKNQIEIILDKKMYAHWTEEELSMAFTPRYMGKKAFLNAQNKLKVPLPSLSKLHRWASKLDIKPGSLECVLKVMKAVAPALDPAKRVAVMSFDDVKSAECYELCIESA